MTDQTTILVVEDEPLLMIHARLALEDEGFAVIGAASADEALVRLEQGGIGAVFADVRLGGGMDGVALGALVRRRWPTVGIVLTSGAPLAAGRVPPGAAFLSKPFTLVRLVETVRSQLGPRRNVAAA